MQLTNESNHSDTIKKATERLRAGGVVILCDEEDSSFYLCCKARGVSSETVNTLIVQGRGVVCAALDHSRAEKLRLLRDAISIEARTGVTTGISSADRAITLDALSRAQEFGNELVTPGHIFPVTANDGGLLYRVGIAEGVLDLLSLSGEDRVGAFVHLLNETGERAGHTEAIALSERLQVPLLTLSQITRERMIRENIIEELSATRLPVREIGEFQVRCFRSIHDGAEHLVLTQGGDFQQDPPPIVRVQSEHRLSDLLTGKEFFTHTRNRGALKRIAEEGRGIFIYVRHPRRGLLTKTVQELGSVQPMALREYGIGCQILKHLGATTIRILTNSTRPLPDLEGFQIQITERISFLSGEGASCPLLQQRSEELKQ